MGTCDKCKWFKPVEEGQYMVGGWCGWQAPMIIRGLLWGKHNERIKEPQKETCSEFKEK